MQINNIAQPPDQPQPQPQIYPEPAPPAAPEPKKEGLRVVFSVVWILILAPLIALFLINFVFQSYEVDGQSMETTLQHQDRLIIVKTGKTWASLWNNDYIPKRGEVIIFHNDNMSVFGGGGKQLIKRVIALPGERIVVKDGDVTVYNDDNPGGFDPDDNTDYEDNLPASYSGNVDTIVPEGAVFVMGDNRVNSRDSRDFGPVAADNIVGHLSLRIFPLNKLDSF